MLCDIYGRRIAGATRRDLGVGAEVDAAAEERTGGEHDGARAEAAAVCGRDAGDARAVEYETRDHPLRQLDAREALEQFPHRAAVQCAIALRPGRPDGGARQRLDAQTRQPRRTDAADAQGKTERAVTDRAKRVRNALLGYACGGRFHLS